MAIEIYRDAWGIPHLRAGSATELAHAQGLVTARDRAWQMETERHRAEGTSASFLGASALAWDRFARRAGLDDTARRCFDGLERREPETAQWVRAYVDGVNEGLAEGADAAPEFARTGLVPGHWHPWTPLGVWLATHILFAGFPAKLWREQVAAHLGPDAVGLFATDGPGTSGSNGWLVSGERTVTGRAVIAGDPHRWIEDPGVYQQIHLSCPEFDVVGLAVPGVPGIAHFGHTGTVAWAITNAMSDYQDLYRERLRRTGAGVEALGPDGVWRRAARHTEVIEVAGEEPVEVEVIETDRGPVVIGGPEGIDGDLVDVAVAGLRGDSTGPGGPAGAVGPAGAADAVGTADAASPGGAAGAANAVGFAGVADAAGGADAAGPAGGADAAGPAGVAGAAGPAGTTGAADAIGTADAASPGGAAGAANAVGRADVADAADPADPAAPPLAISLRYPPRVTGDLGFGALLPLLRARRVADVDEAFDRWAEPVNVVQAADTDGGVLHRVAGRVPLRAEANRVRLVPAWEPGHDWHGWHESPRAGLTDGVAVMANQRGPAEPLGVEFAPPHRADRIAELLAGRQRWSAADMPAIHTDTHLASASPLLDHLRALDDLTPEASALRDRLLAWDRRMDAGSADAAHYAAVRGAVVRQLAAHPAFAALATPPPYPEVFRPWLALLPRVGFALEHLLRAEELYGVDRPAAVRAAVEEVAAQPPAGVWGDTHRLAPWRALDPETPYDEPGLSGDHDCVLCTSGVPGLTDLAARGPAARYVWDLARREDSRWVVPFGASGDPGSPHHRDQLSLWLGGELVPVVTDWALLKKETDV
ncbi:penicillin acylase family protein [Streptomyces sp. NRRL S-474]|uniref:penicillin acylase family protein n=2 Tax=unclassified Streptomyces TaxID=2593676 RepID=UPI0004C95299|nr:penicillin acylase family protein [Streptomyces sp. NRRL S-474]